MNKGLMIGSQLPYIEKAIQKNFAGKYYFIVTSLDRLNRLWHMGRSRVFSSYSKYGNIKVKKTSIDQLLFFLGLRPNLTSTNML